MTEKRFAFVLSRMGYNIQNLVNQDGSLNQKVLSDLLNNGNKYGVNLGAVLKPVYFDVVNGKPTYIKYGVFVLTKEVQSKDKNLKNIAERLESNNIGEIIDKTAVKLGAD